MFPVYLKQVTYIYKYKICINTKLKKALSNNLSTVMAIVIYLYLPSPDPSVCPHELCITVKSRNLKCHIC